MTFNRECYPPEDLWTTALAKDGYISTVGTSSALGNANLLMTKSIMAKFDNQKAKSISKLSIPMERSTINKTIPSIGKNTVAHTPN